MALTLLFFGFLIGLRHATEADHLAAMATMASGRSSLRSTALQGAAWGTGHTLTLLLFGGVALILGDAIPDNFATMLEGLVGLMLVGLGLDVWRRIRRERIHFHTHAHEGGVEHFHAHGHRHNTSHKASEHQHAHPSGSLVRALLIGLIHGLAGSAALIVFTAQSTSGAASALVFVLMFGLGSIVGMALLSVVIAVQFRGLRDRGLTRLYGYAQFGLGLMTIGLGANILWDSSLQVF